jgi:hypothetical protein
MKYGTNVKKYNSMFEMKFLALREKTIVEISAGGN